MSFSGEVKEELSRQLSSARHCQLAELSAIVSACGMYSVRPHGRLFLVLQSENLLVARKANLLLRETFDVVPDVSVMGSGDWKKSRVYTLAVRNGDEVTRILQATKFMQENGALIDLELPVSSLLLRTPCCRRAFLRGAFLSMGSISNPEKSYHFEIVCVSPERAEQLQALIRTFGLDAKTVQRKKHYIVYIKEGAQIVDMLNIMEAHVSLMNLENIRIVREMRNDVNRKVNCEAANINKTVSASVKQMEDIRYLETRQVLDHLPPNLVQIARLRLENQDASLKELGEMLVPPVGKSGVNHRLRKLSRLAEELRQNKEGYYYD